MNGDANEFVISGTFTPDEDDRFDGVALASDGFATIVARVLCANGEYVEGECLLIVAADGQLELKSLPKFVADIRAAGGIAFLDERGDT